MLAELTEFEIQLRNQILKNWKNYNPKRIDLAIPRDKQQYDLAGKYICVEKLSSADAEVTIILNDKDNGELDLVDGVEIETLFKKVFITNTAQADEWIDIIFGADFKYKKTGQGIASGGGGITLGNNEIQITWSAANSLSIAFGANATSDAFTYSTDSSFAHLQLKAKNDGTPAAGDTIDFFLLLTCGDPDGAGADEYDTVNHAIPLGCLDTNSEDPALRTVNCPMVKGGKLYAVNNSAGRAITVSACILEKTVS